MRGGRGLLVAISAAALVGALSGGAGAQSRDRDTPRPKIQVKTSRGVRAVASKTPSLLEQTPTGTPVSLGVDAALEEAVRKGEDLILNREYDDALAYFEKIETDHKDSGLGTLGKVLVYQAQMLENGDFSLEKEFEKESEAAARKLEKALDDPGQEVWDRMLAGGFYGVRGMHAMRKKKYLSAIDDGWEALSLMKWIKKHEPDLPDTYLGLGAYDYYRSQMTKSVSWLPFFPDKRKPGIEAMERAFVSAQYVRPIVQLVLVYTYIDEHRYEDAITLGTDLAERYPRNTLVRVQVGRAYSRKGRYSKALDVLREVEQLQPDNKVVGYYIGANLTYQGKDLDLAESYLRAFIPNAPGENWRGWAYERLGDVYQKRKKPEIAVVYWKKAARDNPDDESVEKKLKRAKKKGVVPAERVPDPEAVPAKPKPKPKPTSAAATAAEGAPAEAAEPDAASEAETMTEADAAHEAETASGADSETDSVSEADSVSDAAAVGRSEANGTAGVKPKAEPSTEADSDATKPAAAPPAAVETPAPVP